MSELSKKEKLKRLEKLSTQAAKAYGRDVLMTGREAMEKGIFDKVIVPTPSLELNQALYCGGFGGIVELFGAPSSGKTSLAIETLALAQKNDPEFIGMWLETEHSIFPEILQQHGIDLDRISFIDQENVDNAENALDLVYAAVKQGIPDMVIINSVAGLTPKKETEEDLSKQDIALVARIMSKFFRKITGAAGKNKTTMIFINQIRDNVGVMFGDPATTTGGKALGFYANQRIKLNANKVQAADPITPEEGVKVSCIVHKNRYAGMHNPNSKCVYYAKFATGIDSTVAIPQILLEKGLFVKSGAWWYYPNKENPATIAGVECKFNSQNAFIEMLRTNKAFLNEIMKLIDVDEVSAEEKNQIDEEEEMASAFMKDIEASINMDETMADDGQYPTE